MVLINQAPLGGRTARPSQRFQAKIGLALGPLRSAAVDYWEHPRLDVLYPAWLAVLHRVTRSAVALMQTALGECLRRSDSDPLAREFGGYLTRHLAEEHGHDVWVEEDLIALGCPLSTIDDGFGPVDLANLIGAQYYWIRHEHPIALLGHIAVMEGYPPGPDFVPGLMERSGLDSSAFRTFSRHEVLDRRHGRDALRALDDFDIGMRHEQLIGLSGLHSVITLHDLFVSRRRSLEQALDPSRDTVVAPQDLGGPIRPRRGEQPEAKGGEHNNVH